MKLKFRLLILTCSAILVTLTNAINLPFEVEETLLDLLGTKDVSKIDMKSIVSIYRKDLNPNYIAYYEIHYRKKFVVLSAGPKTKDYQNVESGPIPSPTQVLVDQARKVGQSCHTFFRLTSMGLYMCENKKSIAVAATFNWITDAPVTNWKKLQELVQKSLDDFKKGWKEIAASVKDEWKTMERKKANRRPGISSYDAEIVSPGSTAKVALENNAKYISVHAIQKRRQHELCAILEDVCKEKCKPNVNPKRIHETKNRIRYIRFQLKEDREVVRKILGNKEISFYFRIVNQDGQQNLKYFSVDLSSHRNRRWSPWNRWSIKREDLFPDYKQHKCCGCLSGCGPVAWAQILGYYDRLAHFTTSSGFSRRFWTCQDGSSSRRCVAPKKWKYFSASTKSDVKKYIEGIRKKLGTHCFFGGGLTRPSQMKKIINWYRARGIGGRIHSHYVRDLFAALGITKKSIRNSAANTVKAGYPAIVGIWVKSGKKKAGHYAVATRYRERHRKYRSCFLFWCRTKTSWQQHFYLHMGWGGSGNAWYRIHTYGAYSARKH